MVTFDNRGVAPSSSPPAPYTIAEMVADTLGLLDHLGIEPARLAGYSMGGWIAETMCARHPERVEAAALIGSCNVSTSWEKAITSVELAIARSGVDLPRLFYATETIRYLPNSELQDDAVVDAWLSMIGDMEVWPNPGTGRPVRGVHGLVPRHASGCRSWPELSMPVLVLAFEHDVDSPPARARAGGGADPRGALRRDRRRQPPRSHDPRRRRWRPSSCPSSRVSGRRAGACRLRAEAAIRPGGHGRTRGRARRRARAARATMTRA